MTVKPAHEDLLLWSQNRVEPPWKICFCSKSGFDGCMAELWLLTAEISIIKIGLVYVIMIVITLWRHPAPSQSLQSLTAHIHALHAHLLWRGFQKRLLCCVQSCYFAPASSGIRHSSLDSGRGIETACVLSEYNSLCKRGD